MPYVSTMLPVLLPIALFVVFTLRSSDKRSKSLNNVKKLLDIYKSNIEDSDNNFKQYASELEQTIAKKDAEVKDLFKITFGQEAVTAEVPKRLETTRSTTVFVSVTSFVTT